MILVFQDFREVLAQMVHLAGQALLQMLLVSQKEYSNRHHVFHVLRVPVVCLDILDFQVIQVILAYPENLVILYFNCI